jgi:hypothetical protein
VITKAQPSFATLSGSVAAAQMPALTGDVTSSAGSTATTLASVVTASTNTKLTYDAKGRVTSGAQAQFSDIGGTVASAQLPNPAAAAKGGVQSKDCSGNGMIQAINADSSVTCSGTYAIAQSPTSTALTTTDLNIAEVPLAAGVLNQLNTTYDIIVAGGYGNISNRAMTFSVKLCSQTGCNIAGTVVTLTSWTTSNTTSTGTSLPWKIRSSITTITTGATGTLEPNGDLIIRQSSTASSTVYQDATLAASASIDLTQPLFLEITAHASGTNQTAQVRQIIVTPVN